MTPRAIWTERALTGLLSLSLLGLIWYAAFGRRVADRPPPPMAVHVEPVADSLWKEISSAGWLVGEDSARDTLVVFTDYECPYCATAEQTIEDALERFPSRLAVLYRHFPLSIHPAAPGEALAVECAAGMGRLEVAQRAMFRRSGTEATPGHLAAATGLPVRELEACWKRGEARARVERDEALARRIGLDRTPSVFLSGRHLSHLPELDRLEEFLAGSG